MAIEKKGKIITITSMKGGVGKTVLTLLLAYTYEKMGKKVLLLDLDLHAGDIAFLLNADIKNTIFNVCDDMNNNRFRSINSGDYICHYNDNIDILAAPKDPRYASKIDKRCLDILLSNIAGFYDIVLIDTNHVLDIYSMMAFEYSNKIISIFTNDASDLKSTKSFVSICNNLGVNNYLLVLNESINPNKSFFSKYSINQLLKHEIDYIIPSSLSIDDIDSYVVDNELYKKFFKISKKNNEILEKLALKILEEKKEGATDEQE